MYQSFFPLLSAVDFHECESRYHIVDDSQGSFGRFNTRRIASVGFSSPSHCDLASSKNYRADIRLCSRITKNPDESTGILGNPFASFLAPLTHMLAFLLTHLLACSPTHFQARWKVND